MGFQIGLRFLPKCCTDIGISKIDGIKYNQKTSEKQIVHISESKGQNIAFKNIHFREPLNEPYEKNSKKKKRQ